MNKTELYKKAQSIVQKKFGVIEDIYPLQYMYWQGYKQCQKDTPKPEWNLSLDKFELFYLLEGCAHGSHLRQDIWRRYVEEVLENVSVDYIDCIWWWCRRDLFFMYENKCCGWEDFMQFMAAFHRKNYAIVFYEKEDKKGAEICYRFDGRWYLYGKFYTIVPNEIITSVQKTDCPDNEAVEYNHMDWWENIDIYESISDRKK